VDGSARNLLLQPRLSEPSLALLSEVVALTVTLAQRNRRLLDDRIRSMTDERLDASSRLLAEREALAKALACLAGPIDEPGFFTVVSRFVPAICGADGAQLFFVHHHHHPSEGGGRRLDGSVPSRVWTRALDGSQALSQIDASESLIGLSIRERRAINTIRLDATAGNSMLPGYAGSDPAVKSGLRGAGSSTGGAGEGAHAGSGGSGEASSVGVAHPHQSEAGRGAAALFPISAAPQRPAPIVAGTRVMVAPLLSPASGKAIGAVQVIAALTQAATPVTAPSMMGAGGAAAAALAATPGFSRVQEEALVHLCAAMSAAWDLREAMTADRAALRSTTERLQASKEDRTVARLRKELSQAQNEVADLRDSLATSAASTKAWIERDQKESRTQQERLRRLEAQLRDKETEVVARLEELEVVKLQLDAKQRETRTVEREKLQISGERDEVLAKLVQYRKHVKQARKVMEEAMEEEQRKRRAEVESVRVLQSKLEDTQRQMADLQKTYQDASETGQTDKLHFNSLSAELDAISKENQVLKKQQKVLHHKLKSLATLEASDLKNQSPLSR